jgi:hypothetical protein
VEKIIQLGPVGVPIIESLPPLWFLDSFDICDSIEVFNHLLFLGITKTLLKDSIYSWVSCRRQWKEFLSINENPWTVLIRFKLDWLKLLPLSNNGNFGGYVSENFLATARLLKYLLHSTNSLDEHTVSDVYVDPPGATLANMNAIQMKKWLHSRRIKVVLPKVSGRTPRAARKNELKRAITLTGWLSYGDEPSPVVNPLLTRGYSSLANLVVSCHSMVCSILNVSVIPSNYQLQMMEHWIKLYLSYDNQLTGSSVEDQGGNICEARINVTDGVDVLYDLLDGNVVRVISSHPNSENNDTITTNIAASRGANQRATRSCRRYLPALQKRNKINLIKLPFTLKRYGSYRSHLSELGSAGEGNVMSVRPLIKRVQGMKKNWEFNVARDWITLNYCKRLTKSLTDSSLMEEGRTAVLFEQFQRLYEHNPQYDKLSNDDRKMFQVYGNRDISLDAVNTHQPLSFLCLDSNDLVACYHRSPEVEEYTGVCIDIKHHYSQRKASMHCWRLSVTDISMSVTFKIENVAHFCLGLPIVSDDGSNYYYIITSNWAKLMLVEGGHPLFQSPAEQTNLID